MVDVGSWGISAWTVDMMYSWWFSLDSFTIKWRWSQCDDKCEDDIGLSVVG
jgi:hypothetical protein